MNFKQFLKSNPKILNENTEKPVTSSIYNDQVRKAFVDFISLIQNENFVLIGGLAVGCYGISRNTTDIDIAVLSEKNIDEIENNLKSKFKRTRKHALEHKKIGVEIEFITPEFININPDIIKKIIKTARIDNIDGIKIKVAKPKYLIALKLFRAIDSKNLKSKIDQFDIQNLTNLYGKFNFDDLKLPKKLLNLYEKLMREIKK